YAGVLPPHSAAPRPTPSVRPAPTPVAPQPVAAAPAAPPTAVESLARADALRKSGDLAGAADLYSQLAASADLAAQDPALLALLDVRRQVLEKAGHGPQTEPTDASVEQKLPNGTKVFRLTPDRQAWAEAAKAVLVHQFTPATDVNAPSFAKQAQDERPGIL